MTMDNSSSLDKLFYPKNVAVVGASPKKTGRGNRWIEACIRFNFNGRIFPVHPSAKTIKGCMVYKNVREIPGDVDLVTFAIPFTSVLDVMKDCAAKGVKFVHLFTAGFSETGEAQNARMEQEIFEFARENGIRIIGPNCMGLYCPEGRISWAEEFPETPGPVAFISQSGQLAYQFVSDGGREGLRFSKVVSYGNASDLKIHDFLNYLADDDKTEIVAAYIEGLTHGREFFEAVKRVTAKKPLIIYKGGQTEGGARATQSHTASIAGSTRIWDALCRQTGIIQVNSQEELVFTALGFLQIKPPRGNRVAILGGAGGGSVTMTDISEKEGLKVPQLAPGTVTELKKIIPMSGNSVNNPMDMAFSDVYENEAHFVTLFKLLSDDPNIDALIFSRGVSRGGDRGGRTAIDALTGMTIKASKAIDKPVFMALHGPRTLENEALRQEAHARFERAGIPTFYSFESAARVLKNMNGYFKFKTNRDKQATPVDGR